MTHEQPDPRQSSEYHRGWNSCLVQVAEPLKTENQRLQDQIEASQAREAKLQAALEAALEHMIWMTGGWGQSSAITNSALSIMHEGIVAARAALGEKP